MDSLHWFLVFLLSRSFLVTCGPLQRQLMCIKKLKILAEDGKCYTPTTQGPCRVDQWIVLDKTQDPFQGYCKSKICQKTDFVLRNGTCEFAYRKSICRGLGERLFNNVYGEAGDCECEDGWYRHRDGKCYQENTQGWCPEDQVLRKASEVDSKTCRTVTTNNNMRGSDKPCIFPFRHKGLTYDGCTSFKEKEGKGWCSTKTDRDGTAVADDWGYCDQSCHLSGYPQLSWSFTEEQVITQVFVDQIKSHYREKLVCGEKMCQEGYLWWEDTETGEFSCFEKLGDIKDCMVILSKDPEVDYNKLICSPRFLAFTVVPDFARDCKKGKVWSKHRNKCVRSFS